MAPPRTKLNFSKRSLRHLWLILRVHTGLVDYERGVTRSGRNEEAATPTVFQKDACINQARQ